MHYVMMQLANFVEEKRFGRAHFPSVFDCRFLLLDCAVNILPFPVLKLARQIYPRRGKCQDDVRWLR